jgi:Phosphotransferase system IIC components, glucose/maltose/N-acetylglucosamine-specific
MGKNYGDIAKSILEQVGGNANVVNAMHCHTRLRITLKDTGLVDVSKLEKLDVAGAQFSGEQLQVIIGAEVGDIYDAFVKLTGNKKEDTMEEEIGANCEGQIKKKRTVKGVLAAALEGIVGSIVPVLPILIASGILKAVVLVLQQTGLVGMESPTVNTLSFVADAAFYFLPVFIGGFAAKKFGVNVAMGMLLGAALIHPTFITFVAEGAEQSIFGIPIYNAGYSSTILPAILSVWVMSYVEKFITKHSPKAVRIISVPFITLLVMIPVTFCLLAPLGAILSNVFANVLNWVNGTFGMFAVAVFAAIIPWVVMTGMHLGTIPISIESISATGMDKLVLPAFFIANFSQGAACLAVGIKSNDSKVKSLAFSSAFSSMVPGISEPGMYGITLKYKTPLWATMIGSAAGGLYFGITGTGITTFLNPNIFAFAGYVGEGVKSSNIINAIIGVIIAIVVSFIVTMIIYKPTDNNVKTQR